MLFNLLIVELFKQLCCCVLVLWKFYKNASGGMLLYMAESEDKYKYKLLEHTTKLHLKKSIVS